MSNQRTHYVTTTDGVIIGGTVHGAGHAAPLSHPEALADALTDFFARAQKPA